MKPLKAQLDDLEGAEAKLGELFATADTYRKNPVRKRRIKAMVLSGASERRRRPLAPALAAVLLVAGTATAATIGHRLLTSEEEVVAHAPAPPQMRVPPPAPAEPPRVSEAQPEAEQSAPEPEATPEAPAVETPAPQKPSPQRKRTGQNTKTAAAAPQRSLAAGEDPTRVVQAIRALRQQGDAAKAQGLLNDYMKKNPNGLLSEEALALSIEAAHTRQDPKAKVHARRYLSRFPNGRHRAFARRVLAE